MFSEFAYPIICTDHFAKTINFYEDHFRFAAVYETEGFAILKRQDWPSTYLAVMKSSHDVIPEAFRRNVSGMILNYPVHDVDQAYHDFYWDGLTIVNQPSSASCGRRHFFIEDPNGILIDVAQNVQAEYGQRDPVPEVEFVR